VPVVGPDHDHRATARKDADAVAGQAPGEERRGVRHNLRVRRVEEDAQPLCARHVGDVAVAEVEAEQLGVVR
jgi:hypothetical protein